MCVCVGGGGGDYSPLSFIYRLPREDYVALWPCRLMPGQERSIHHHQDIGVGRCFDLGGKILI